LGPYAERFTTAELNASFYRWPRDSTFAGLAHRLPDNFQLSVKAPRGLTHAKRLYAPDLWIERTARGWHELGARRGVLFVQLRPRHERGDVRLSYFHDRIPPWIPTAVEFRHPSWHDEAVFRLLEHHQAAYCMMSGALYIGSYPDTDLRWWADRIREWLATEKDVYVYFNNDAFGHAVRNAEKLHAILSEQ
jgi:uncharacterized protein YecE (DUF72 family)